MIDTSKQGNIGIITVNNPPVNALSPGVPEGIRDAIATFEQDDSVEAIVLIGVGRTFIAGADIKEFGKITSGHRGGLDLNVVLNRIEACTKPVVAAIHGTALGGGLETAMGCHYRVAVASAQVGQPEVKLGIIPGAGGTQRLPRLAGVAKAVEMCAGGEPIPAKQALEAGILDEIVPGDLLAGAIAFAQSKIGQPRKTRDLNDKLGADNSLFAAARETARKRQRNLIAPQAAIDAIEAATKLPFEQGLAREAELFQQCLFSDQSKALIHVFFGEREVAKVPDIPKDTPQIPVNRAAIVGAGTMGGGIAMVFANAGIPVLLKEADQAALDRGLETVRKNYRHSVARGRITNNAMNQSLNLIKPTLSYEGFEEADIVIEAVFEGMALKKQVFADLHRICKPGAILASNSSALNIDEIGASIGTHFFSPANVMRLLEIVRGAGSSNEVIATCMALSKRLGKIGVLVGNCHGFVGNRMFAPYRRQAQFLVEEGASPEAVDQALYDWGMAMGPLAVGDLAGLDVGWRIRKESGEIQDTSVRQPLVEDRLCELGHYGQKTGAGWYRYDEQRRSQPHPVAQALLEAARAESGIPQRQVDSQEIVERCIYALVNEGARILEEGYAMRSVDIDIIYINGYGFPAYRGGPMKYADMVGLAKVYDRVRQFEEPAPLLARLAKEGRTFSALPVAKLRCQ